MNYFKINSEVKYGSPREDGFSRPAGAKRMFFYWKSTARSIDQTLSVSDEVNYFKINSEVKYGSPREDGFSRPAGAKRMFFYWKSTARSIDQTLSVSDEVNYFKINSEVKYGSPREDGFSRPAGAKRMFFYWKSTARSTLPCATALACRMQESTGAPRHTDLIISNFRRFQIDVISVEKLLSSAVECE